MRFFTIGALSALLMGNAVTSSSDNENGDVNSILKDHQRIDLFVPSTRFPCFRQPAITKTQTHILAFAENRNVTACAPAFSDQPQQNRHHQQQQSFGRVQEVGSLQLRRSADNGQTWGPLQSLFVGNIDFYTTLHDPVTNTTWLMLQHSPTEDELTKRGGNGTFVHNVMIFCMI